MNREDFNSSSMNREEIIENDYRKICLDDTFDEGLYDLALKKFLESDEFLSFSSEYQTRIKDFFDEIKVAMNKEAIPGKFKLPKDLYLEVVRDAINCFSSDRMHKGDTKLIESELGHYRGKFDLVRNNENKFDDKVASLIWDIYKRDDLAIGVHGTKLNDDFDISPENCDFFKHGIMIDERYKSGDARRTVNFQDLSGKQVAFGHISFLQLMNYKYNSRNERTSSDAPKANYSCIVVRPKNMKNTAYDENCPEEYCMVSPKTNITTSTGKYLRGHLIKPEFILGIFKDNNEFVRNPKCDLEKLTELNEIIGIRNKNEEKKQTMTEKLTKETEDIKAHQKNSIMGHIRGFLSKSKDKEEKSKGDVR